MMPVFTKTYILHYTDCIEYKVPWGTLMISDPKSRRKPPPTLTCPDPHSKPRRYQGQGPCRVGLASSTPYRADICKGCQPACPAVSPPHPQFYICGFNKLQIENTHYRFRPIIGSVYCTHIFIFVITPLKIPYNRCLHGTFCVRHCK